MAFSCKASICPSCAARRMEDGADHLVRNVIPQVPMRQWVLSFPRRVRFLAARHPALVTRLLAIFTRTVFAWQRRVARRRGVAEPRTAGVTAVQRAVGKYCTDRLKTVFAAVAEKPGVLRNSANCPLYLLCFAVAIRPLFLSPCASPTISSRRCSDGIGLVHRVDRIDVEPCDRVRQGQPGLQALLRRAHG